MQFNKKMTVRILSGAAALLLGIGSPMTGFCAAAAAELPAAQSSARGFASGESDTVIAASEESSEEKAPAEKVPAEGSDGSSGENTGEIAASEESSEEKAAAEKVPAEGSSGSSGENAGEIAASEESSEEKAPADGEKPVKLRVSNWEEYIDLGDWDEEETIELPSGDIIGENPMLKDFEEWYYETYGIPVEVEYSTFGTNEDLYNMLTLGDVYDLVCPSEYLIMKLMAEKELVPLSDSFFDNSYEYNYYSKGAASFIKNIFETSKINGEPWAKYAAGYMWGVTGLVYNPEIVDREQVSSWNVMTDPTFKRKVTIKDSVRDAYFAAVGAIKSDLLTSEEFKNAPDYKQRLETEMNDTSPEMIGQVQNWLKKAKDNVYSFETDAGKADMITGKVAINYQWSGDAVYTLDQAEEDDFTLCFAVPEESTDIYFDGWVMLKKGIDQDPRKQHAAEAFINFLSRPDNAIRNMYYIGYTSVITGGGDPRLFEYAQYCYEAEDEEEETVDYDLSYFFAGDGGESDKYVITASADQLNRQLYAAYPPADVIDRSSIMVYFDDKQNADINRMWVNVRCFDIRKAPVWGWVLLCAVFALLVRFLIKQKKA